MEFKPLNYTNGYEHTKNWWTYPIDGPIPFTIDGVEEELQVMHGCKDYIRQDHLQHNAINSDQY